MLRAALLLLLAAPAAAEGFGSFSFPEARANGASLQAGQAREATSPMPAFEFRALLSKELVRFRGPRAAGVQSLDNGAMLVYFWGPSTYCGACGQAMSVFESLHREFALKGLQVVGLGVELPSDGERDAEAIAAKFSHLIGPYRPNGKTAAEAIGLNHVPSWALVDARGNVRAKSDVGVDPNYLAGKIREMLQLR